MEDQERSGKATKGQVKSWKVMEGHGRSFPDTKVDISGGWVGWVVLKNKIRYVMFV